MTAYFDNMHTRIHEAAKAPYENMDMETGLYPLEAAEHKLVFDCTVAAMMVGFPEDLRAAVHRAVLQDGLGALPVNAVPRRDPGDPKQHGQILSDLCWNLHSIFHEVAERRIPGFNDSTLTPLHSLYARGEEEREGMIPDDQRNLAWEEAQTKLVEALTDHTNGEGGGS